MKLREWYQDRGLVFIAKRLAVLLRRYGLTPAKAQGRIFACLASLNELGCAPTFPVPGILVERYPDFTRRLLDEGVEIAVHGYQHINLNDLPLDKARGQLERAVRTFERLSIHPHGFRGPYIGCCDALIDSLPAGMFRYSSNKAVRWNAPDPTPKPGRGFYTTVEKLYQARDSTEFVCVPWNRSNMVEIPVCIPDDLQLLDGLRLGIEGLAQAWQRMLQQTYQRGELFTLLFHTELAMQCEGPLVELLTTAGAYRPGIWIAQMGEISEWWQEKSTFQVEVITQPDCLSLKFICTPRATILTRGLNANNSDEPWDGMYHRLPGNTLFLPADVRPFIGLDKNAPAQVISFLNEQGYIVETGETAASCETHIDAATLSGLTNQVQIINYIESSNRPLIRYSRWPDGAKSALCITGDLDALSLLDYFSRLFSLS